MPELISVDPFDPANADVVVRLETINISSADLEEAKPFFRATQDEALFFWHQAGAFCVKQGCQILVDPIVQAEERILRLYILGPILAMLLHQRGKLVLHASAVSVAGEVVAFVGESGWGKSTTVAALNRQGYDVIADDVVAIEFDGAEIPKAFPGFPQLKLWPESVTALGDELEDLPRLHPRFEKRACSVTCNLSQEPIPLKLIYILAKGTNYQFQALSHQEAFLELVGHSYNVYRLEGTNTTATHFQHCAKLASIIPARRWTRPFSSLSLPDLVRSIEADLAQFHAQFHDQKNLANR